MKFCKDCRHAELIQYNMTGCSGPYWRCNRFGEPERWKTVDPVTGNDAQHSMPRREPYCDTERLTGWIAARLTGTCGIEGRYFQPKEVENG